MKNEHIKQVETKFYIATRLRANSKLMVAEYSCDIHSTHRSQLNELERM